MKLLSHIPSFLRNKYLLAGSAFVVWMLFFDRNDVFTQMERKKELQSMKEDKTYYSRQIEENRNFSKALQFNAVTIEKFARENYFMKKDNEDLYLIEEVEKNSGAVQ